jgi:superfamily II DNA or RNA helicase
MINQVYAAWRSGVRRVLLQAPCGSGKTVVFCQIMKDAASKGKRSLMIVRGKELVGQTVRRLAADGVTADIYQGGNTSVAGAAVSVASISTLHRRKILPEVDLLVIDESHLSYGDSYRWLLEQCTTQKILAVTATPYNRKGMQHIADKIVYPVTIRELQEQGFLVAGKYFAVQKPDLSGIGRVGDDFNQQQLAKKMNAQLSGDCVKEWRQRAAGRPTIIFAVNVEHSQRITELYNSEGITTKHVDADTPDDERAHIFAELKLGSIQAISNVGVLSVGVDIPEVSCLQVMRPTMSKALWHQMLGRGTRTAAGKADFLVLDHSNNTINHGMIEDEIEGNLAPVSKAKAKSTALALRDCPECLAVFRASQKCPNCGTERKKTEREIQIEQDAELKELTRQARNEQIIKTIIATARLRGHKKGWCRYQLREKLGAEYGDHIYINVVYPMEWVTLREDRQKNTTGY